MTWFYDRLFDRPNPEIRVDQSSLDWIRANEPKRWGMFGSATQRNAQRIRQVGWILCLVGLVQAAVIVWASVRLGRANIPQIYYALVGLVAGFEIGIGRTFIAISKFYRFLALLKGEREEQQREG